MVPRVGVGTLGLEDPITLGKYLGMYCTCTLGTYSLGTLSGVGTYLVPSHYLSRSVGTTTSTCSQYLLAHPEQSLGAPYWMYLIDKLLQNCQGDELLFLPTSQLWDHPPHHTETPGWVGTANLLGW